MDMLLRTSSLEPHWFEGKEGGQAAELDTEDTLESILEHFGVVDKPFVESIRFFVDVPSKASAGKWDSDFVTLIPF